MSKSYELDGTLKEIMETKTFEKSGFTKREFVVTDEDDRYPQHIKFNVTRNNCALLDRFAVGDRVRVTFSIRGNQWQDRYFVDLNAFKLEKLDVDGSTSEPIPQPDETFVADTINDEDMPF